MEEIYHQLVPAESHRADATLTPAPEVLEGKHFRRPTFRSLHPFVFLFLDGFTHGRCGSVLLTEISSRVGRKWEDGSGCAVPSPFPCRCGDHLRAGCYFRPRLSAALSGLCLHRSRRLYEKRK